MHADRISNPSEALAWCADCTLATVEDLAFRSRPPKGELSRQITMAQQIISWMHLWDIEPQGRAVDVMQAGGSVREWIDRRKPAPVRQTGF